jgi:threonine/homoserine/homoserine lactone efflux protein
MNLGVLVGICLMASLSPGPAVLSSIETSLSYGFRRTLWHTLGLAVGEIPQTLFALAASIWMTHHFPVARGVIGLLGSGWFLYLAWGLIFCPRSQLPEVTAFAGVDWQLFWRGAWVNFSNPKTFPWMLVIIQVSGIPTEDWQASSVTALLLVTIGSETSVMTFYAFLGDRLRPLLRTPSVMRTVDRVTGLFWALLAGLMAWQVVAYWWHYSAKPN